MTETNVYVTVVTLSIQYDANVLEQLKSDFKRTINWNKCQSKPQNQCLHFLIYPSFQGVNRLFVLSLESKNDREAYTRHFLLKVKIML